MNHRRLQASVFKSSRKETPLFFFAKSGNHKEAVATGHLKHINENSIRKHRSFVPDGFAEKGSGFILKKNCAEQYWIYEGYKS